MNIPLYKSGGWHAYVFVARLLGVLFFAIQYNTYRAMHALISPLSYLIS